MTGVTSACCVCCGATTLANVGGMLVVGTGLVGSGATTGGGDPDTTGVGSVGAISTALKVVSIAWTCTAFIFAGIAAGLVAVSDPEQSQEEAQSWNSSRGEVGSVGSGATTFPNHSCKFVDMFGCMCVYSSIFFMFFF